MKYFRKHHLLAILKESAQSPLPVDAFLRKYFQKHRAVGSKDRAEICTTLYDIIRWKGRIDAKCPKPVTWEKRIDTYLTNGLEIPSTSPQHVKVSFPKTLFDHLQSAYGVEKTIQLCLASNKQAPVTIRINPLKTARSALLREWQERYGALPCRYSPLGITFPKRINFFALPEFKRGLFEVQDEGSQLVARFVRASPKDHVLDFCAGAGGKTLAFAPQMNNRGQIYLYDIRPHALLEAKKRLKRAGIQNGQILDERKLSKKGLQRRMDWILLDVPCSGSGTLRRNPDMKWKFERENLEQLVEKQKEIFESAWRFLKPGGKIVYATCSIFPEENEEQIAYFKKKYSLQLLGDPFQSFPKDGEMDGFYCAVLSRM